MCMIVREIHYQLALAPWDSIKFTYPVRGHLTTSASQGLFWTRRKRAWVVVGDSWALGINKNLILHKHYQISWKKIFFSVFRADVGNLEFLKFQSKLLSFYRQLQIVLAWLRSAICFSHLPPDIHRKKRGRKKPREIKQ